MDLGWAQATWNKFFERAGLVTSVYFLLRRIRDELKRDDIIVDEYWDPNGHLDDWVLDGVQLFSNTDEAGRIYVSIIDNGLNWDVELFNDSARGAPSEVASGSIVKLDVPGTITLTESNDSGISGTVNTTSMAASVVIWLRPRVGLLKQIDDMVVDDAFDAFLKTDMSAQLTNVITSIASSISSVESFSRRYLIPYVANKLGTAESSVTTPVETSTDGVITYEDAGILRDLIDAMNDETVAAPQTVETPTIGSAVESADAGNTGTGTVGTPTWFEYAENCIITLECVTETIGSEAFGVKARRKDDGTLISAQNNLTIKKVYLSTDIGISGMTLTRTIVDSGAQAAALASWVLNGETSTNTNDGRLYGRIKDTGPGTRKVWLWSSESDRDADDTAATTLVLYGELLGDGVMTLSAQNSSGLSGTVTVTYAIDGVFDVNMQVFKEEDKIYLDFTRTSHSFFELFFGRLYKAELPSDNLGAHTIADDYANRGYSGLDPEDDS